MQKLSLFFDWTSPPSRALMMLSRYVYPNAEKAGITYNEVRLTKGWHRTEEFAKINPRKTIPAMVAETKDRETFSIGESQAIIRYILNTISDSETAKRVDHLYPREDFVQRAKIDEYLDWNHVGLRQVTNTYAKEYFFTKIRGLPVNTDAQKSVHEAL